MAFFARKDVRAGAALPLRHHNFPSTWLLVAFWLQVSINHCEQADVHKSRKDVQKLASEAELSGFDAWENWNARPVSRGIYPAFRFRNNSIIGVNRTDGNFSNEVETGSTAKISSGEHDSLSLPVGMPDVRGGVVSPHVSSTGNSTTPQPQGIDSSSQPQRTANETNASKSSQSGPTKPADAEHETKSTTLHPQHRKNHDSHSSVTKKLTHHTHEAKPSSPPKPTTTMVSNITTAEPTVPPAPPPPRGVITPDEFQKIQLEEGSWDKSTSPYRSQEDMNRLWSQLFVGYHKDVPPIPLDGGPLPVGVGINFVKIRDVDEVAGTMSLALALRLCWDDARLSFNAVDYFNKSWIHEGDKLPVRPEVVWTPDITVLNGIGSFAKLQDVHSSPLVLGDELFRLKTGVNVLWSRPMDVTSNCRMDMSLYPFDEQVCDIVIGSWTSSHREMLLVPQPFFAEYTIHSSEFKVANITVRKSDVYTRGTLQRFNEITYTLVLQRYPHYHFVNFILPMLSITLLTVTTMWMNTVSIGPRVNSATKLLLCIVSIMFITARGRPALHGDIWIDRFQGHCLAIAMSAVLESLFIDNLSKGSMFAAWMPRIDTIDMTLRSLIFFLTAYMVWSDFSKITHRNMIDLKTSIGLHVGFIYLLAVSLLASSVASMVWLFLPAHLRRKLLGRTEASCDSEVRAEEDAQPLLLHCDEFSAATRRAHSTQ